MKKNSKSKILKLLVLLLLLVTITGCTQTLVDKDKKPVRNTVTGQNLTKNILCQPKDKVIIKLYEKNNIKIEKLPECTKFKINSGKYEGLWAGVFVKPLAFIIILIGKNIGNYALSLIIVSLLIRLIAYPLTKKTALQSELMKKAQPELTRIQNKYKGKQDQASMMAQSQEMMAVYKKYNINPLGGCLFAFIQLPLFIAFFEAVQRTPAIFEDSFLKLQLGTTPAVGIAGAYWYSYLILMLLIAGSTFYAFTMTMKDTPSVEGAASMKKMPIIMSVLIIFMGFYMPSALGIYWVTTNVFTIIQNIIVKRSKEVNGKK